jgi:hypothetical protein
MFSPIGCCNSDPGHKPFRLHVRTVWRDDGIVSPRIIHIPLSGGDRKAQARGFTTHRHPQQHFNESVLIRSAAEAKIREADRLECEAWNAVVWAGGPAMPSPGEPQAEPTIAKAVKAKCDLRSYFIGRPTRPQASAIAQHCQ